jgi:hypothetical protein
MKITDLLEAASPFGGTVPITKPDAISMINRLYAWVQQETKRTAPPPTVVTADHGKMQWAAQRAHHHTVVNGQVFGWYSPQYPATIFLSSQLNVARNKAAQAILVHEMVHYLQDVSADAENRELTGDDVDALEAEADAVMHKYLSG